eukprot:474496_1
MHLSINRPIFASVLSTSRFVAILCYSIVYPSSIHGCHVNIDVIYWHLVSALCPHVTHSIVMRSVFPPDTYTFYPSDIRTSLRLLHPLYSLLVYELPCDLSLFLNVHVYARFDHYLV